MKNLNMFVKKYLEENGIKISYFSEWIGCDRTQVGRWLNGQRDLPAKYTRKVLDFLSGEYLHKVDMGSDVG